ncbi:phosphonoacetaldehyde reductase [Anaerolentibacter hominis]|uniref:phosphonoacetaldehyde reductase n=1 Tax=Anaerolentibacter hominis TaxID=3079009 RepID=UPI0031B89CF3
MNLYYNPVKTVEGAGAFSRLPEILKEMKLTNGRLLVLAWGEKVFEHRVFTCLQDFNVKQVIFAASNPTVSQLFKCYQETKEFSPDAVVAIGGGSIMDVGKSLCCMYGKEIENEDALREFIEDKRFGSPSVRWIGVPTTSGTGSEVTCWATIWDPDKDAKRSVENHDNYAYAALIDPGLTEGMPLKLAVSSALDAVCHAVESYWANGTNTVSRAMALRAIHTIMSHMEDLLSGKTEAYSAMAQGSMLAGLAFSNTKTTACHSISYPLTMYHNIPHGAAVAMLLAPVLQMNVSSVEGMPELLDALDVTGAEMLKQRIGNFLRRSGQPDTLGEWGIKPEDLPHLAELGMTKGRADNNPVEITVMKIKEILESVYS